MIMTIGIILVIYLFMIMPKLTKQSGIQQLYGKHYAHRGLHDHNKKIPENSLHAFKRAVKYGYGIELDIQLSKDNIPVVFHDETLNRMCGVEGKVSEYTYEALCQFRLLNTENRIPTLEETLSLVDGKVPLIVEIKMYNNNVAICTAANKLLSRYSGVYCIESFYPQVVLWYKKNAPTIIRGQLSCKMTGKDDFKLSQLVVQTLISNCITKPDFIAYCHQDSQSISRLLCRYLYRNTAVAWTICSQKELDQAMGRYDLFIFEGFIPKA